MVLVNQDLATQSADDSSTTPATCNREEIQSAFAYLSNPLIGLAHLIEPKNENDQTSVVVLKSSTP
jgi:hypothetical protein